ncbi:Nitric oxide dioxygenase [Brevundimonas diminuta]|uniref:NO-inducible flavohemoprotein n=1 Tax=Brevundimonas diminuta TaxID=293 RepID=UPI000207F06C|nr:NO-inducible flavohemoprotein [Brevundimonas diminuta]EGF96399.1 flavohemoprotein [Brevundimonas diminuta ATCC 11568]OWR18763.1 nitric oxide dioxygenase [Brevundimonas diminuta]WQE44398.1 NO-inducible flavohemoprotein [Brevundimonas diminuta]SPU43845.1 Nitric oxide dioxygenase [Brevundimonas diminuta]SUW16907.1 Nitric oxide dioxygenase [Brevundimonas diminuta]
MAQALSERTIALVKATVPALEAHGLDIVREMYSRMFQNPEIRDLFNQSHQGDVGSQPRALTGAILAYAKNIDNLSALAAAVERIAQKHVGLQILPEHYPHVGNALLGAIAHVLGEAATEEIMTAWGEAYWFLADILITREAAIYEDLAAAHGGWNGWRAFEVVEVRPESSVITSFVLKPKDGGPVLRHRPGQYLTFWFDVPGHAPIKRNYSISCAPNDETYRISVKREDKGLASGWLHDNARVGMVLKVGAPAGDFFLPETPQRPVVLLSGGVGLTPMVSMLETLVAEKTDTEVHYVHGAYDAGVHAMGPHIRALTAAHPRARSTVFYEAPANDGDGHDHAGRITGAWLSQQTPIQEADYYLCGPRPFLRALVSDLRDAGVPADRIHYEFFSPADEILAA